MAEEITILLLSRHFITGTMTPTDLAATLSVTSAVTSIQILAEV
jgi:hypothetical protein